FQFQFDDQALHATGEEMKTFAVNGAARNERVALLVEHRHVAMQRVVMVLALMRVRDVPECGGDCLGLVSTAASAERPEVGFHESQNVGVHGVEETDQALQVAMRAPQVAGTGDRQMKTAAGTGGVTDVVEDESHSGFRLSVSILLAFTHEMASG